MVFQFRESILQTTNLFIPTPINITNMVFLSIVAPCFNEAESVAIFFDEVRNTLDGYDFEVIYVNDGSSDDTLENIKDLADANSNVKYVSFSRNFGKESAIYAGLKNASADLVCVMDVDLQHPPRLLPEMIEAIEEEGYDVVAARRTSKKGEPKIKSWGSHMFYKLFNMISRMDLVEGATDYRIMTRQVVDAVLELSEYNRFSKGLFQWVGFETKWIPYENVERIAGQTTWSVRGLVRYSIEGIVAFTTLPLAMSTLFGTVISVIAFAYLVFIIAKYLLYSDPVRDLQQ